MARRSRQDTMPNLERIGALASADEIKANSRRYRAKAHRDAITAGVVEEMLMAHAMGVRELDASKVKALEILLDRRKPRLSAVDSTVTTKESWSDSLKRIAEARKPSNTATVTPIAAPLQPDDADDSTEDAA